MTEPQENLFGERPKKTEKKNFFNKYDLISYFLKSIRLGHKKQALRIFWCMKQEGMTEFYIAKKLVQFATEDSANPEAVNYAWTTFQIVKEFKSEENSLQRLILYLANKEKMWETEGEHHWELRRIQVREETKAMYRKKKKPFELPEFVFDQYTSFGKSALKKGEQIDRRFSGVYEGSGLFMRACHLKWGENQPNYTTKENAYSPHLEHCKKEGLSVDVYLRKHKISIDEFLNLQ
jgi:hypothetical protein